MVRAGRKSTPRISKKRPSGMGPPRSGTSGTLPGSICGPPMTTGACGAGGVSTERVSVPLTLAAGSTSHHIGRSGEARRIRTLMLNFHFLEAPQPACCSHCVGWNCVYCGQAQHAGRHASTGRGCGVEAAGLSTPLERRALLASESSGRAATRLTPWGALTQREQRH